ncbi:unnamed protein product [Leuciscus chuanchicus]
MPSVSGTYRINGSGMIIWATPKGARNSRVASVDVSGSGMSFVAMTDRMGGSGLALLSMTEEIGCSGTATVFMTGLMLLWENLPPPPFASLPPSDTALAEHYHHAGDPSQYNAYSKNDKTNGHKEQVVLVTQSWMAMSSQPKAQLREMLPPAPAMCSSPTPPAVLEALVFFSFGVVSVYLLFHFLNFM